MCNTGVVLMALVSHIPRLTSGAVKTSLLHNGRDIPGGKNFPVIYIQT